MWGSGGGCQLEGGEGGCEGKRKAEGVDNLISPATGPITVIKRQLDNGRSWEGVWRRGKRRKGVEGGREAGENLAAWIKGGTEE